MDDLASNRFQLLDLAVQFLPFAGSAHVTDDHGQLSCTRCQDSGH
jgi:hypothetical protein